MNSLKILTTLSLSASFFSISELHAVRVTHQDAEAVMPLEPSHPNHVPIRRQIDIDYDDNNTPFNISKLGKIVGLINNNLTRNNTTCNFLNFTEENQVDQIRNFVLSLAILPTLRVTFVPPQDGLLEAFLVERDRQILLRTPLPEESSDDDEESDEVLPRSLVPLSSLPDQLNLISREEAGDPGRHILSNFSPLSSGAVLNLRASSSGLEITDAALEDQLTSSSSED